MHHFQSTLDIFIFYTRYKLKIYHKFLLAITFHYQDLIFTDLVILFFFSVLNMKHRIKLAKYFLFSSLSRSRRHVKRRLHSSTKGHDRKQIVVNLCPLISRGQSCHGGKEMMVGNNNGTQLRPTTSKSYL